MKTLDSNRLRYRVNDFFPITKVLEKLGYKNVEIGDRIKCPYHDDTHPDCEVFDDGIFCWADCRETWDQYDLLTDHGVSESYLDKNVPEVDGEIIEQDYEQKNELPDNQELIDREQSISDYLKESFDELGIDYIA